jgi:hypothetical protein
MAMVEIIMPYIGGVLSVNSYKIRGRNGVQTNKTKPEVVKWMDELSERVRGIDVGSTPTITLAGKFRDDRAPDLANLHKVIGDALKVGLGVDDKGYKFVDAGYDVGFDNPSLVIKIEN